MGPAMSKYDWRTDMRASGYAGDYKGVTSEALKAARVVDRLRGQAAATLHEDGRVTLHTMNDPQTFSASATISAEDALRLAGVLIEGNNPPGADPDGEPLTFLKLIHECMDARTDEAMASQDGEAAAAPHGERASRLLDEIERRLRLARALRGIPAPYAAVMFDALDGRNG
jgi:hypothetical protein